MLAAALRRLARALARPPPHPARRPPFSAPSPRGPPSRRTRPPRASRAPARLGRARRSPALLLPRPRARSRHHRVETHALRRVRARSGRPRGRPSLKRHLAPPGVAPPPRREAKQPGLREGRRRRDTLEGFERDDDDGRPLDGRPLGRPLGRRRPPRPLPLSRSLPPSAAPLQGRGFARVRPAPGPRLGRARHLPERVALHGQSPVRLQRRRGLPAVRRRAGGHAAEALAVLPHPRRLAHERRPRRDAPHDGGRRAGAPRGRARARRPRPAQGRAPASRRRDARERPRRALRRARLPAHEPTRTDSNDVRDVRRQRERRRRAERRRRDDLAPETGARGRRLRRHARGRRAEALCGIGAGRDGGPRGAVRPAHLRRDDARRKRRAQ